MNETELIQKMQNGDEDAFESLYETYRQPAFRTAFFITGNQCTGEDVVQEAFVQCFLHISSLHDPTRFRPWFYKILTRLAWKMSQADKKSSPVENIFDVAQPDYDTDSIDKYLHKEEQKNLLDAINALEQKQRTAVVLYYYNGMSVSEVASAMGCMEGTVKSRLYFARKKLYKKLSPKEIFSGKVCEKHES